PPGCGIPNRQETASTRSDGSRNTAIDSACRPDPLRDTEPFAAGSGAAGRGRSAGPPPVLRSWREPSALPVPARVSSSMISSAFLASSNRGDLVRPRSPWAEALPTWHNLSLVRLAGGNGRLHTNYRTE